MVICFTVTGSIYLHKGRHATREMEFCDNSVGNHNNDLAMNGMR